jgi:hypothetical protein
MPDGEEVGEPWTLPTPAEYGPIMFAARVKGCNCQPDVHIIVWDHPAGEIRQACVHHAWHCKLLKLVAARWN